MNEPEYRFEKFKEKDFLVFNAETNEALGFYVPPQDRDYIVTRRDPNKIINRSEFKELKEIPYFDYIGHGLNDWMNEGFSIYEALDWRDVAKVSNVQLAKKWSEHGFSPHTVRPWLKHLIGPQKEPEIAASLQKLKIKPDQLKNWTLRGKIQPRFIPDWFEYGFKDYRSVKPWSTHKFTPSEAHYWQKKGVEAREAVYWRLLGLNESQFESWKKLGFNGEATSFWINDLGINDPVEAKEWLDSRIDNITEWRNAGYSAIEALEFRENDIFHPPEK